MRLLHFAPIIMAILFIGCRTNKDDNDQRLAPADESVAPADSADSPESLPKTVTPSEPNATPGSNGAFGLTFADVTPSNSCASGDSACLGNGQGFACATTNGDMGICMANRFLGCECRGLANSPLLEKEELPKVASSRTCDTNVSSATCSGKLLGTMCSGLNDSTGYCLARTFGTSPACGCTVVTQEKSHALGNTCASGNTAANPCVGLREGNACLTEDNTTGVCSLSVTGSTQVCGCVPTEMKPAVADVTCLNTAATDVACRAFSIGMPCAKSGVAGICQPSSSSGNSTICRCERSDFQYFKPIVAQCSAGSIGCANRPVGDKCLGTLQGTAGTCRLIDGPNSTCGCAVAQGPEDAPLPPDALAVPSVTSTTANVTWQSSGGSTSGFKFVYSANTRPVSCVNGEQLPVTTLSKALTGLTPNTLYYFRLCSVNDAGKVSPGVVVATRTPSSTEAVLFTDNFNRADSTTLGASWTEVWGNLSISANRLAGIAGTNTALTTTSNADVIVQADYDNTVPTGTGHVGLFARLTGSVENNSYLVQVQLGPVQTVILYRNTGGTWVTLSSVTAKLPQTGKIRLRVVGSSLEASINNVIYASAVDTVYAAAGKAGIRMNQTIVRMDNFTILKP